MGMSKQKITLSYPGASLGLGPVPVGANDGGSPLAPLECTYLHFKSYFVLVRRPKYMEHIISVQNHMMCPLITCHRDNPY